MIAMRQANIRPPTAPQILINLIKSFILLIGCPDVGGLALTVVMWTATRPVAA